MRTLNLRTLQNMDNDELTMLIYNNNANSWSDADRVTLLTELKDRIKELTELAGQLVYYNEHATRSWLAHMRCSIDSDHGYLDRSHTMQDTIDELVDRLPEEDLDPDGCPTGSGESEDPMGDMMGRNY